MRRVLSVWLPHLPLERRDRMGDPRVDAPFAIVAEAKGAWRLAHVSEQAIQAGVTPGLSVPDARAICPDLLTEPADPLRETELLMALVRWSDRLSPRVTPDGPDGLLLDISGCAHLLGGEDAMGSYIEEALAALRLTARIGIADTKRAARALARYGDAPISVAPSGGTRDALHGLPIAALGLEWRLVSELARTGLKTVGQLYEIKPSELARRFGLELSKSLASALGHAPDPFIPKAADPIFAARMTLPEPIGLVADLENVLRRLAESVCQSLGRDRKGARRFVLTVRCVDSGDHLLSVGFARPCADAASVVQQFARPLDALEIAFGADWFRLVAEHVEPVQPQQGAFEDEAGKEDATARLISTLGNRLGFDHVHRFLGHESHLPEREFSRIEAVSDSVDPVWKNSPRNRPIRLYKNPERLRTLEPGRPPKRFVWRRKTYVITVARGPERLTPEWWREPDSRLRDYWTVETDSGARLWLLSYPAADPSAWHVAGRFP